MLKTNLTTTKSKFYHSVITLWLKPLFRLSDKDASVLSWLLNYYNEQIENGSKPQDAMFNISTTESRKQLKSALDFTSVYDVNNYLLRLRKKGILDNNNNIKKKFIFNTTDKELVFNFIIKE